MISYNNSAPNSVNNVGQFGATEGSIGAYKSAAEYAADSKYWAMLSQKNYDNFGEILKEVERLYAEGALLKEDIEQLKSDFENQNQILLGLIQQTGEAIDNTNTAIGEANAATDQANQAVQDVLTQLDKISNMSVVATTLPPGAPATGSFDSSTGVFSFGIPEGQPGKDGTNGVISDIGDVAIGTPVPDDYGFFVDKDNGGLYRTSMSDIAKLVPAVASFNGRTGLVVPTDGDYTVSQITGAAASGVNNDITQITGLTTALSIDQGGTGSSTAEGARVALNINRLDQTNPTRTVLRTTNTPGEGIYLQLDSTGRWGCFSPELGGWAALGIGQGGTGSTTVNGAKVNLGLEPFSKSGDQSIVTSPNNSYHLSINNEGLWGSWNKSTSSWKPLGIGQGGTGATTVAGARANLNLENFGSTSSETRMLSPSGGKKIFITNEKWGAYDTITAKYLPLSIEQGGTGGGTADAARISLVAAKSGDNSDITSMTNVVNFTQSPKIPNGIESEDALNVGQLADINSTVSIAGTPASSISGVLEGVSYLKAPDVYDIFITYGQSNSAGEAILSGDTSGFPPPSPKSMMYDFTDNSIKPIIQNIVSSTGVVSSGHAWGEFENEWYRLSGRGSVAVHCGRGAQTITALSKGGTYYTALLSAVTSAKAAMVSGGYAIGDVYVLFHQGESDMSGGTTYNAYRDRMITLIDNLSVDVGMKFFGNFTVGCPLNRTEESWARIQNAQRWVCNSKENAVTIFDGCGSFTYGDGNIGNTDGGVHYTQKGYNLMGREGAKGLWSIVNKGQTTKTSSDLLQYSNFVAPWSRAHLASGTLRYSASDSSWIIISKDNPSNTPWRLSNLHKPVPQGDYISIEVADNAANWFSLNATVNKEMGREGVKVFAEPVPVGNAFTTRLTFYADISIIVNTTTGALRYNRPLSSSIPSWISKNISVEVTSEGNIQLVHGRTSSIPSVSKYTTRTDGGIDAGDVAFRIVDDQRTRIISTGTSSNWVAVCLRDVLLSPSNLTESGIIVNISGFYAPAL